MPPMANNLATSNGEVTQKLIEHYIARAKNNVALIIIEHSYVIESGKHGQLQLGIHRDELVDGLKRLASAIHAGGAKTAIQINHGGARCSSAVIGHQTLAPSAFELDIFNEVPRVLTIEEIKEIIIAFGRAAIRAKMAGFDAVEIHGAHGFLLNEFYSPLTNLREDEYGGSWENRMRLPLEVVAEVKKSVGEDLPIFYRLGSDDMMAGGITIDDSIALATKLVEAGVKLIDVSGGLVGSRPDNMPPGYFVPQAWAIKKAVNVPVVAVGGIKTAELADSIIREGKADLVAIGRALLADSMWAVKAIESLGD
ncbi:MAG: NADH:flavin oxidoreductase [Actinobacteria bacterium]|nr:NADH:flavin oxidoreductase [Actinomycetota bacterium]